MLDWVYEEEIYGRGENRAYWWSPDSSRLAFLRIDDTPVPTYVIVDRHPVRAERRAVGLPEGGRSESARRSSASRAPAAARSSWVDTAKYPAGRSPDRPRRLDARQPAGRLPVQNRTQTWLDLNLADRRIRRHRSTMLRETSKFWISADDVTPPTWLKDGSFLWLSERSGWRHLYHYKADGTLIKQVTSGKWEMRTLHGVDETGGWIYFSGTERSPIGGDVYRIRLDGTRARSGCRRPTGTHTARVQPGVRLLRRHVERRAHAAAERGCTTTTAREVRSIDENRVAGARRVPAVEAGVPAGARRATASSWKR